MRFKKLLLNTTLTLLAVITLLPFLWNITSALKPSREILRFPPTLFPEELTFIQFTRIFQAGNGVFSAYFFNTFVMSISTILIIFSISILAAYSFSALPFKGSNLIFVLILAILMVPFQALLIPLYSLMNRLGLLDRKTGLVLVYTTFYLPFCIFMMKNYFSSLPKGLRESALIDGASEARILFTLYLPLSLPAIATIVVFVFLETWNDFILSLIFSASANAMNIQVGIMNFGTTRYSSDWGIINAGAALTVIPPIILFLLLQKYYVQGLTSGVAK